VGKKGEWGARTTTSAAFMIYATIACSQKWVGQDSRRAIAEILERAARGA